MLKLEKGEGISSSFSQLPKFITTSTIGVAITAVLFGEGPIFILLKAASEAKLPNNIAISWLAVVFLMGGLLTLLMSLYYRQPIYVAFSIPAVVLIGSALTRYPFSDVIGAVLLAGIIVLLIGISGLFKIAIRYVPMPIIQGMIAGTLVSYGIATITALPKAPVVAGSTLIAFLLLSIYPALAKKFPPVLGALVIGFIIAVMTKNVNVGDISFRLSSLTFVAPTFNLRTIMELAIPLAILSIGFGNVQALGILSSQGYTPPTNAFVAISGLGTIFNSFFGGHTAVIAGPSIAICAGAEVGPKEGRYAATFIAGILSLVMGLIAPIAITFTKAVPGPFIDVLAGVAMFSVLVNTFAQAFGANFRLGALFALLISMSKITVWNIGAPFWAIIGGTVISLLMENSDYRNMVAALKTNREISR
ncbi:benzoate/H(+) symporter BenE family transporter [Paradesulfitobacterium ferrireducens]|uniref:benzoate/H(+) symporter BenE family transporter n=1 Tax=Paradesulfitobacterium ferrireducens TaxID=2816476 RepID=UPI001A8EB4E2|nr:benzoate/H(+) symporter BenE family transporter [Paradesulfitobacterium ferrireducens]